MTKTTTRARARTLFLPFTLREAPALTVPFAFALAAVLVACGDAAIDERPPRAGDGVGGPAQPAPPRVDGDRFLVRDGVPSADDAAAYGASLELDIATDAATLDAWRAAVFGDAPLVEALYRNTSDLGFWRELSCTETIDRGQGGCAVRNWAGAEDKEAGAPNLGTVAMRLDSDGRVEFYAFGPDGARIHEVILDSEGEKRLPNTCTMCHGGQGVVVTRDADGAAQVDPAGLGASFRELEPSQLEPPPGLERADLEDAFQRFNNAIAQANRRVMTEAEGAPPGAERAASAIADYIGDIYARGDSLDVDDPAHMPQSWLGSDPGVDGSAADEVAAKRDLWTKLVNPHCMGCHRTSDVDFSDYDAFAALRDVRDGVPEITRLLALDHDDGAYVMPQAELTWTNLQEDEAAQAALQRWLTLPAAGELPLE